MLEVIAYIVIWCFFVYGIMSLLQDINRSSTYKKIEENVKLIMTVKNVENGKYKITYKPAKKLPIEEFLRPQRRFKHMFKPGNEWMIEEFQKEVDARWQELLDLEEITNRE